MGSRTDPMPARIQAAAEFLDASLALVQWNGEDDPNQVEWGRLWDAFEEAGKRYMELNGDG